MSPSLFNRFRKESEAAPMVPPEIEIMPSAIERPTDFGSEHGVEKQSVRSEASEISNHQRPSNDVRVPVVASSEVSAEKTETYRAIEQVLEHDLDAVFYTMNAEQQLVFKHKGEETASKIELLLQATKVKVNEIFNLIVAWLASIPGVNSFFLKQEAKIKTDQVLKLKDPLQ
jgi:hypothetical protein